MDEGSFSFVSETSQTKQYQRRDFGGKKSDRGDWFLVLKKNMTMTWPSVSYIKFLISHKNELRFHLSMWVNASETALDTTSGKKKKKKKIKMVLLCFMFRRFAFCVFLTSVWDHWSEFNIPQEFF